MRYDTRQFQARLLMEGLSFSQVCRLCGQDPRQPPTDGDRHQREALHGTPPILFLFPFSLAKTHSQEPL